VSSTVSSLPLGLFTWRYYTGEVQNLDREVKKCLIEVFKKTDEEFLQKASSATPSWKDGSTVAAVLVLGDTVYSANLGDSKAVLCRRSKEGEVGPCEKLLA